MDRQGDGRLRFNDIALLLDNNTPTEVLQSGKDVEFSVGYSSVDGNLKNVEMSVDIFTPTGQCMLILNSELVGTDFAVIPSTGRFLCRVTRFPLAPGQYYVTLFCRVNGIIADWIQQAMLLTVEAGDFYGTGRLPPSSHGGFLIPQDWRVESTQMSLDGGRIQRSEAEREVKGDAKDDKQSFGVHLGQARYENRSASEAT